MALKGCYAFLKWSVFLVNLVFWVSWFSLCCLRDWQFCISRQGLRMMSVGRERVGCLWDTAIKLLLAKGDLIVSREL